MFVFTRWWSFVGAAIVLWALLQIAHHLIVRAQRKARGPGRTHRRQSGVKTLVIGSDGRASTSKLQVLMWTVAVLYAFTFLLLWGRSIGCDADVTGGAAERCEEADTVRGTFATVLEEPLETEYYALLGLPTLAAVAAKALTANKVAKGEIVKQNVANEKGGVGRSLAEVVSADDGRTDLIDFQYFAFNLLALAYFSLQFVASPGDGLPEIPPTLLALTGVAVTAYTGKKALERDAPAITAVLPRRVTIGEDTALTVMGTGFGSAEGDDGQLTIDGVTIPVVSWGDRRIKARIDSGALGGLGGSDRSADVVVVTADDAVSPPYRVDLEKPDAG